MAPPVQLRCLVTGVRVNQALPYFLTLQVRARPPAVPTRCPGPEASEKTPFLVRDANDRGEPGRASARGRVTSDARRHHSSGLPSRASPRDAR